MSNNTIVDSKEAVSVFLESLLKETEETVEVVEPAVALVAEAPVPVETETQVEVEVKTEIVPDQTVLEKSTTVTLAEPEVEVKPEVQLDETEPATSSIPFQALMFKVAGLSLAVRLVELNGVVEWDESKLTEMPGHSPFYLGLLQYLDKSIPVIDTARLVFPEDKLVSLSADKPLERVTKIVLIDDGKWGLACDGIEEVIDLSRDDVKWRENRSKRKWMAGTVIQHMCALIDADGFSEMLADGSHNRK